MIRPAIALTAALLCAAFAGAQAATPPLQQDNVMTSTSQDDLRGQIAIAGQPRSVEWATETLRPTNPDSFPPGPSEVRLWAVLTYGSGSEVAGIVEGGIASATRIAAPAWFPPALGPGRTLDVVRHHRVSGFGNAAVMTVPDAPGIIILQRGPS